MSRQETLLRSGILRQVLASGNVRRGATRSEEFSQVEEPAVWAGLAT
ncbi:MAG: hypothetical protein V7K88_22825 [Nostoc sp.]